jgi:hypothetical protein
VTLLLRFRNPPCSWTGTVGPSLPGFTIATWGISGDVCHIYIVLFYKYANHICISHTAKTNYGDECDLPPTIHMSSVIGKKFLLVRNI